MGHAALGVVPAFDGDGVVKPPPQPPVVQFLLPRLLQVKFRQGNDGPPARLVKQGLFVGAVVEHKGLPAVPGTEVGAQQGEHPVFGFNFANQQTVLLGKAGEALQQMGLSGEVLDCPGQAVHPVVGKVPHHPRPPLIAQPEKFPQGQLLLRQAGEKPVDHQLPPLDADFFVQGLIDPFGVGLVGGDLPLRPQGEPAVLRTQKAGRGLLVEVGRKHAAQKPGEAAVIVIADL